jgi:hypothetical protein
MTGGISPHTTAGAPYRDECIGKKLAMVEGTEGIAYREDRKTFAGLDASGSEAPWFPPSFQICSSQTEPLIGNYLPAQRSRSADSTTIIHTTLKNNTTHRL